MKTPGKGTPAPAFFRWGTSFLAAVLTFPLIWLLGFVLANIGNLKGPGFPANSPGHVDPDLSERAAKLEREISEIDVQASHQCTPTNRCVWTPTKQCSFSSCDTRDPEIDSLNTIHESATHENDS